MKKTILILKFHFISIILLSSVFLFNACSDDSKGSKLPSIGNIDITDASILFIGSSNPAINTKGSVEASKLFKITQGNSIQEVTYKDVNGNKVIPENSPTGIFDINNTYVVIIFGYDDRNPTKGYLVDKFDGYVFDMGDTLPVPPSKDFINSKMIKVDINNNFYYLYKADVYSTSQAVTYIRKVTNDYPANTNTERISPDFDSVDNFSVSSAGNILYRGNLVSDESVIKNRILKGNGEVVDVPFKEVHSDSFIHWAGDPEGLFYSTGLQSEYKVQQVDIDELYKISFNDYGDALGELPSSGENCYLINLRDLSKTIIYSIENKKKFFVMGSGNGSTEPVMKDLLGDNFKEVVDVAFSHTFVYIAVTFEDGSMTIEKVDSNGEMTQLLEPGKFSIYKLTVSPSELVTFNAYRHFNGRKIVGTINAMDINPESTLEIMDEVSEIEVTKFEQIDI